MDGETRELILQVDGMTCEGCAEAVRRTIRRLDRAAEVEVDLAHGRVRARTTAQTREVAEAINRAGYDAKAMPL